MNYSQNKTGAASTYLEYTVHQRTDKTEMALKNQPKFNKLYHSHTLRLLSSDVDTNRRFWSTNVIVLTAPRCRSYSCTISPDLMSHWNNNQMTLYQTVSTAFNLYSQISTARYWNWTINSTVEA